MRRGRSGMMPTKRGLQDSPCLRRAASLQRRKTLSPSNAFPWPGTPVEDDRATET